MNHGDVEIPGQCPVKLTLMFPTGANAFVFTYSRNLPRTVRRLRRARHPDCAGSGVVVQKLLVRTSAQELARSRRWYRGPPLGSGLALNSRNLSCPLPATLGNRHVCPTKPHCWRRAPDCRVRAKTHSRRALGVWRRSEKSSNSDSLHRSLWDSLRDGLLYHSQLTTTSSATHPEVAIQPSQEAAHTTSVEPKRRDLSDFQILWC